MNTATLTIQLVDRMLWTGGKRTVATMADGVLTVSRAAPERLQREGVRMAVEAFMDEQKGATRPVGRLSE
jgi:hypothetical protein